MSKKKYLRKNEFRYDTSPKVRRPDGRGHTVYVSAKQGHQAKVNVITHSTTFFGEPTHELSKNPQRDTRNRRPARFSSPRWESDTDLKNPPRGIWRLEKKDRRRILNFNRKYKKKNPT